MVIIAVINYYRNTNAWTKIKFGIETHVDYWWYGIIALNPIFVPEPIFASNNC